MAIFMGNMIFSPEKTGGFIDSEKPTELRQSHVPGRPASRAGAGLVDEKWLQTMGITP